MDPSGLLEEIIIQTWAPRWTWWDSMWASYWGAQNGWESGDTGRRGPPEIDPGGGGGGGETQTREKCDPKFWADDAMVIVAGKDQIFTGADLNFAARTVYAEAASGYVNIGGVWTIRADTVEEFDAVASVLYNRLGAGGISGGVQNTFTGVARAPAQFSSVTKPGETRKFDNSAPGKFQNLSVGGVNRKGQMIPGDCDDLKSAVSAIQRLATYGPRYDFLYNRGGTEGRGTVIGGSRFWR